MLKIEHRLGGQRPELVKPAFLFRDGVEQAAEMVQPQ